MTTINTPKFISSLVAASVLFGIGGPKVNAQEDEPTAEEIISELTSMKPVLACEVFEAHRYNKSTNFLGELRKDLCEPKKKEIKNHGWNVFGSVGSVFGKVVDQAVDLIVDRVINKEDFENRIDERMNALTHNQKQSLVESFKNIKELQIRDVNMPAPSAAEEILTIEKNDLKILSFMPNLETLKIMGNHKTGGLMGSDAKYNLTKIDKLELPQIDNVYIDKNDKLETVSISQLDAEYLVISDKNETEFKNIKSNFGNTGRHYGNNELGTITLGEKVKVSNLYIGNSNDLTTIDFSLESDTVEKIFINTESSSLTNITIPSVNELHIWKEDVKADGIIKSTCHTFERNPNVFRVLPNQFLQGLEQSEESEIKCHKPSVRTLIKEEEEFQSSLENLAAVKAADDKVREIIEKEYKKFLEEPKSLNIRDVQDDMESKIRSEVEWNNIKKDRDKIKKEFIEKVRNFLNDKINDGQRSTLSSDQFMKEFDRIVNRCDNTDSFIVQAALAAPTIKLQIPKTKIKIDFGKLIPLGGGVLKELSSKCKERLKQDIKNAIESKVKVTIEGDIASIEFPGSSDDGYIPRTTEEDPQVSTEEEPRKINNPQVSTEEDLKKSLEELLEELVETGATYGDTRDSILATYGDIRGAGLKVPFWLNYAVNSENSEHVKVLIQYQVDFYTLAFSYYGNRNMTDDRIDALLQESARTGIDIPDDKINDMKNGDTNAVVSLMVAVLVNSANDIHTGSITYLHEATVNNDLETARLLIEAGATPYIKGGPSNATPIDLAAHRGYRAMLEILESYRPWYEKY